MTIGWTSGGGEYWLGVSGPVGLWRVSSGGNVTPLTLERPPSGVRADGWARRHVGMIVQVVVFIGAAVLLLLMRSDDLTAGLCVLALALSAVGGGGPLLGAERDIPILGKVLTVFAWIASPLAFPIIALAILYFPTRSRLLDRHPWLHAVPFLVAAPLIGPRLMTALYLVGVDRCAAGAVWDATHPDVYFASFAARSGSTSWPSIEGRIATGSTTTRTSGAASAWRCTPPCRAYSRMRVRDGVPIVACSPDATARSTRPR